MTGALVGLLVAVAVRAALGPPGRRAAVLGAARGLALGAWGGPVGRGGGADRRRRGNGGTGASAGVVAVTQIAALLRSGLPPGRAWEAVGVRCDVHGVPDADDAARVLGAARVVPAVVAGVRLAVDVGAPLAAVLDDVVEATVAEDAARVARETALAGPRATARVLAWLPGAGVLLGYALGADPVGVLLAGGIGTVALLGAAVLVLVGRRWTASLVRAARAAGEEA
ncbi:type II secretion system F family protein [Luteimicrobium sp. NPDC057192]|uniref:type II secretion system F family protein n=1 Tax=Luteimicrobium sp. NPDC057192 TaxID=3346042 RepID=UPI00362AEB0B